jgi:hypothetical protein
MRHVHQTVKIRIDVIRDEEHGTTYVVSNDEFDVVVRGASFRDVMIDLRAILARRVRNPHLSLQFYSADSTPDHTALPRAPLFDHPMMGQGHRLN